MPPLLAMRTSKTWSAGVCLSFKRTVYAILYHKDTPENQLFSIHPSMQTPNTGSSLILLPCCASSFLTQTHILKVERGSHLWFVCLLISRWESGMYFLLGASNDLSTCWAFQSGFYFDLHQQGMEWSRLGLLSTGGLVDQSVLLRSGEETPQRWFIIQGLFFACGFKDNWIKLFEEPKFGLSCSGQISCIKQDEDKERQAGMSDLLNWLFLVPALVHMLSVQADYKNWPASFVVIYLWILLAKKKLNWDWALV